MKRFLTSPLFAGLVVGIVIGVLGAIAIRIGA